MRIWTAFAALGRALRNRAGDELLLSEHLFIRAVLAAPTKNQSDLQYRANEHADSCSEVEEPSAIGERKVPKPETPDQRGHPEEDGESPCNCSPDPILSLDHRPSHCLPTGVPSRRISSVYRWRRCSA